MRKDFLICTVLLFFFSLRVFSCEEFININEQKIIDGFSKPIEKKFKDLNYSKLKQCKARNKQLFFWAGDEKMVIC